jgi:16S rRNA C1402 N4-methylase RsmH
MALRLVVNGELETLFKFLSSVRSCLKPEGTLVVISFHSLEDRMVKRALRSEKLEDFVTENFDPEADGNDEDDQVDWPSQSLKKSRAFIEGKKLRVTENVTMSVEELKGPLEAKLAFKLLRRKAVKPSVEEITINPRARSARLRSAVAV